MSSCIHRFIEEIQAICQIHTTEYTQYKNVTTYCEFTYYMYIQIGQYYVRGRVFLLL